MSRPASKELTQRELEVMHVFWKKPEITAMEAREVLSDRGVDRAYVTVANLVRVLGEKGFLAPTNRQRPFKYRPTRSFEDVSGSLIRDLVQRVFHGSREELLVQMLGGKKKLSKAERELLSQVLKEQQP